MNSNRCLPSERAGWLTLPMGTLVLVPASIRTTVYPGLIRSGSRVMNSLSST